MKRPKYKLDEVVKVKDCDREFKVYQIGITKSLGVVYYPVGENGFIEDELEPVSKKKIASKLITNEWMLRLALFGVWTALFVTLFTQGKP